MRGVTEVESVAAHSHSLALLAVLVCDAVPDRFDREKVVTMALIHDLPEVETMDIPMPAGTEEFKNAKAATELSVMRSMCASGAEGLRGIYEEYARGESEEARLVKGLDKVQMMTRICGYEREGRGYLEDFWNNAPNFRAYGIDIVEALFDEIFARAGRGRPDPENDGPGL